MERKTASRPVWSLWPVWVLASGAGGWLGLLLGDAILQLLNDAILQLPGDAARKALHDAVIFGSIGAGLGTMQWLALRCHGVRAGWWVVATALGWTGVGAVAERLAGLVAVDLVLGYTVLGAIVGALQWLVLRRHVARAWWWLAANPAGLALGTGATSLLVRMGLDVGIPVSEVMGIAILYGVMAGTAGMLTGGVLVALLVDSHPSLAGAEGTGLT